VNPDPYEVLRDLGLDAATIGQVDILSERHGHAVYRVVTANRSYILKCLPEAAARVEVGGYLLLQALQVPTLPLCGHTTRALLLEDLAASPRWRLARRGDLARPEVGRAVACWYRTLHAAGEALLSTGKHPGFLGRETDRLDRDSILAVGRSLGLAGCRGWSLAAENIELLKAAERRLSTTLNYNDFCWTNLALAEREHGEPDAVVFDYHLLGIGMRYSDCRNVSGSLAGDAVAAFWDAYGRVDPRETKLDRPLATLYSLDVASRMSHFPEWAEASRHSVVCSEFESELIEAIELAHSLCAGTG
jgi:hypothetical protein